MGPSPSPSSAAASSPQAGEGEVKQSAYLTSAQYAALRQESEARTERLAAQYRSAGYSLHVDRLPEFAEAAQRRLVFSQRRILLDSLRDLFLDGQSTSAAASAAAANTSAGRAEQQHYFLRNQQTYHLAARMLHLAHKFQPNFLVLGGDSADVLAALSSGPDPSERNLDFPFAHAVNDNSRDLRAGPLCSRYNPPPLPLQLQLQVGSDTAPVEVKAVSGSGGGDGLLGIEGTQSYDNDSFIVDDTGPSVEGEGDTYGGDGDDFYDDDDFESAAASPAAALSRQSVSRGASLASRASQQQPKQQQQGREGREGSDNRQSLQRQEEAWWAAQYSAYSSQAVGVVEMLLHHYTSGVESEKKKQQQRRLGQKEGASVAAHRDDSNSNANRFSFVICNNSSNSSN